MRRLTVVSIVSALVMSLTAVIGSGAAVVGAQGATPVTCAATTPDQNSTLVRNYLEMVYNQKRLDLVDPMLTDDVVRHNTVHPTEHPSATPAPHNADDVALIRETVMTTFPDFHITVNDLIASTGTMCCST